MRAILLPDGRHIAGRSASPTGATAMWRRTLETADRALYAAKANGRDRATAGADPV